MRKCVDTNVLVRLIAEDDQAQLEAAKKVFASGTIVITPVVLVEAEWVLRFSFKFTRQEIHDALDDLLELQNVETSEPQAIEAALQWFEQGLDFADAMMLALASQSYDAFYTFDKKLAHRASSLSSLPVHIPT